MKLVLIYILAVATAYFVVYFAVVYALRKEVPSIVSTAVDNEFAIQELKGNVYTNF